MTESIRGVPLEPWGPFRGVRLGQSYLREEAENIVFDPQAVRNARRRDLLQHFREYRIGKNIARIEGDQEAAEVFNNQIEEILDTLHRDYPWR